MVTNQAFLFLIFIINGIQIGILFDIFRILRKSFKTSDITTYIQDILFWVLTGFILLYSIFTFSNGEIRFYMFLAVFLGCLLYMLMFSKYFIKINVGIILTIKKVLGKILSILILPFKIILNFLRKIFFEPIKFVTINMTKFRLKSQKKIKNMIFLKNKKDFCKKSRNI